MPSQVFPSAVNSAAISASVATSQGNASLLSNSPAISVTRSLKRSFWYVNASSAPSRRAALAMPWAIERLESRPVTRTRLPARNPMRCPLKCAADYRLHLAAMRGTLLPVILLACGVAGCGRVWNDPYPASDRGKNILYAAFTDRPKHLDPAQSYTSDEYDIIQQIYEPPFQYHYLKRPYQLIPATATEVPHPRYYDAQGRPLPADADASRVAYSEYDIRIREGIRYQPHPAFARDDKGEPLYLSLPE